MDQVKSNMFRTLSLDLPRFITPGISIVTGNKVMGSDKRSGNRTHIVRQKNSYPQPK